MRHTYTDVMAGMMLTQAASFFSTMPLFGGQRHRMTPANKLNAYVQKVNSKYLSVNANLEEDFRQ